MMGTQRKEAKPQDIQHHTAVWTSRFIVSVLVVFAAIYSENLQRCIDTTWEYCLRSEIFNSVYFETLWTVFCFFPVITVVLWVIVKIPFFDQFKIRPSIKWQSSPVMDYIKEGLVYVAPLLSLDTFLVKKYPGVSPSEWVSRRASLIQTTRALPVEPPSAFQIVYQLTVAFIVYDSLFALFHYALHKDRHLYKYIHAAHHDHGEMHAHVVNKLSIIERIVLVLSANESLKIINSHPLTRTIFVPLFVYWLTENHFGYDFPWGMQNLVPWGLVGGPRLHYDHHMKGDQHYAPFFTHVDKYLLRKLKWK